MKEIVGNLVTMALEADFEIIFHGCNCLHKMENGIAGEFARRIPAVAEADKALTTYGYEGKLGTFSTVLLPSGTRVLNAYTQFSNDRGKVLDYPAMNEALLAISRYYGNRNLAIAFPMIGCGLAGGDWDTVHSLIEYHLGDEDITLVRYDGS